MLLFSYLLMSGVTTGALYALVALGFVVVHKATGVINFAQGEFFMFAGFIAWMLHVQMGVNYALTFVLAVAFGFLLGCLTDRIAFRPIAKSDVVSLVLATVGIAFVLEGLRSPDLGRQGRLPLVPADHLAGSDHDRQRDGHSPAACGDGRHGRYHG